MKGWLALIAILIIAISSCEDFDLEPNFESEVAFGSLKTAGDIEKVVTPIYREYASGWGTLPHTMSTICYGSDDMTTWEAGNKAPFRVYDKFDYGEGENADNTQMAESWRRTWKVIYFANTVIEGLKTSEAPKEAIKIGDSEARFFRAMAYFFLVRGWGNVPIILDGQTPDGKEERAASVSENYQHIELDLLIAKDNLPDPADISQPGKVSSAAAKTVLADLYLTWAGWPVKDAAKYELAAKYAKEVIDLNYFELLPIEELWLKENQNSRESVFSLQFSETEDFLYATYATAFHESRGFSDIFPERQFFYDFPEGPRKEMTFYTEIPQRKWDGSIGEIVFKDPPYKPWPESQRKHPMYKKFDISSVPFRKRVFSSRAREIFRYAEVLLIYAEAQSKASGIDASVLEAYNQIKRRAAGLPYNQPVDSIDVNSVTIDEIVQEKAWELAGESKRWWDLVRLEKVAEVAARRESTEEVKLMKSPGEITWKQYISPIPQSEIDKSGGILVQNPEGFNIQ